MDQFLEFLWQLLELILKQRELIKAGHLSWWQIGQLPHFKILRLIVPATVDDGPVMEAKVWR